MDFNVILQGIITLGIVGLIGGVVGIYRKLGEMNGSVREVKIWCEAHAKQDDERFDGYKENISAIWRKLDNQ